MLNKEVLWNEICRMDGLAYGSTNRKLKKITIGLENVYRSLYNFHVGGYKDIDDARLVLSNEINVTFISINIGWSLCAKTSIDEIIKMIESIDSIEKLDYYKDSSSVLTHIDALLEYTNQIVYCKLLG